MGTRTRRGVVGVGIYLALAVPLSSGCERAPLNGHGVDAGYATGDAASADGAVSTADGGEDRCSPLAAADDARARLAAGEREVFLDCEHTLRYTRTLDAAGDLAT